MAKTYGIKFTKQMKTQNPCKKELIRTVILKELHKVFKYPEAVSKTIIIQIHLHIYYLKLISLNA